MARPFILSVVFVGSAGCATGPARAAAASVPASQLPGAIADASRRFGIPQRWIHAIISAESAGRPRAVSRAGAIGLMQLMPATYAELRARYSLGTDPFHVHDNILAGTAYLRELLDRYGLRGMLAAYNAGPRRWEQHVDRGRSLPRETVAYLAKIEPWLALDLSNEAGAAARTVVEFLPTDTLFVTSSSTGAASNTLPLDRPAAAQGPFALQPRRMQATGRALGHAPKTVQSSPLFVQVSSPGAAR
jgi:hypothetical protein